MPTTTKGFRYPQYTDTPDIPRDIQALATDLDNYITNNPITINGTPVSLGGTTSITGLPTQTSNSGKYLTTDGTSASWATPTTASAATPTNPGTVYGKISTDATPGNNGIGYEILNSITTGRWNNAFGSQAMYSTTTGQNNLALGNFSLYRNTTGNNNIAIGSSAGYGRTDIPNSGSYSTIIGVDSGADAIASGYNTIIGSESGNNLSGGSHIAIGNQATDQGSGDGSIGIGYWTYFNAGNISNCIAIGNKALQFNDIDPGSSYIGENIGIGTEALAANTTGKFNVAIGRSAGSIDSNSNLAPLANAGFNTIIGSYAGRSITGGKNVIIGFSALGYATDSGISPSTVYTSSGTNNIIIGTQASPSSSSVSNEITLGNADITRFRIPGLGIDWTSSNAPAKSKVSFKSGYYYRPTGFNPGNATPTHQMTYYAPIVIPSTTTISSLGVYCSNLTGGPSTVRLGIYYSNASGDGPGAVALDAGTVSCSTTSTAYEITVNSTLPAGVYWTALCTQGTAASTVQFNAGFASQTFSSPLEAFPSIGITGGTNIIGYTQSGVTGAFATAGTLGTTQNILHPLIKIA